MSYNAEVTLPSMDKQAAENFVEGGKLAMSLLNFLELNSTILYDLYPDRSKFRNAKYQYELSEDEVKEMFVEGNRKALMIVSYVFKYIANQVINKYNVECDEFSMDIEHMLMSRDMDEALENNDDFESDVLSELEELFGNADRKEN